MAKTKARLFAELRQLRQRLLINERTALDLHERQKQLFLEAWEAGATATEIAESTGLRPESVRQSLRKQGIETRRKKVETPS